MAAITFEVNGQKRTIDADPGTPLLWILREHLGLMGTKYACGKAFCGSCTVHLDDNPSRACITPVSLAEGRKVKTIEGLSEDGTHPLQLAWIEAQVPQCGYCQPGFIMQAAALLEKNKTTYQRRNYITSKWQSLSLWHLFTDHQSH